MAKILTALGLAVLVAAAQGPAPAPVLEHARVIPGDGAPPMDDATIVVERGRIAALGRTGQVEAPRAARRIDLSGKTIVPALVDGHVHLGYQVGLSFSADNYSRATLVDQLNRYAYAGVGAVLSMGTDAGEAPF